MSCTVTSKVQEGVFYKTRVYAGLYTESTVIDEKFTMIETSYGIFKIKLNPKIPDSALCYIRLEYPSYDFHPDIAYDLPILAKDFAISDKVILSTGNLTVDKLNMLYNVIDINTNTSLGEGFGLSLVEGASCGVPVLCAEHGNLKDIWGKNADYIKTERSEYIAGTSFKGDVISTDDFAEKLDRFYEDRAYLEERRENILDVSKDSKFNWSTIANKVFKVLSTADRERFGIVS